MLSKLSRKIILILAVLVLSPWVASADSFSKDLFFGLKNDSEVTKLQEFLRDQGLYSGPLTGNFFALTRQAVKKFQERENVLPAAGYFGPKSRFRAHTLLSVKAPTPASVSSQIAALQDQIKILQKKLEEENKATTTSSLYFSSAPHVASRGFSSARPLGAHYPYKVALDWATNASGPVDESTTCSPVLKIGKPSGRLTEYFPEPHTKYTCAIMVKEQTGRQVSGDVTFETPSWVSVYGKLDQIFPEIETTPFKIGEFRVFNGTTTDILFTNFEVMLTDEMDSIPNRNRKVYFLLRDGATPIDSLISKTDFTFFLTIPKLGEPHKIPMTFPFDIILKPGEEKLISLWVENMAYVKSGTLSIKSTKTVTTLNDLQVLGSFDFNLTRAPSAL